MLETVIAVIFFLIGLAMGLVLGMILGMIVLEKIIDDMEILPPLREAIKQHNISH